MYEALRDFIFLIKPLVQAPSLGEPVVFEVALLDSAAGAACH